MSKKSINNKNDKNLKNNQSKNLSTSNQSKNLFAMIKLLLPYLLKSPIKLVIVLILLFAANICYLAIPRYTEEIVDLLVGQNFEMSVIINLCLTAVGLSLFGCACDFIRNSIFIRMTQKVIANLRQDVFSRLLKLRVSFIEDTNRGDIINRVSIDIEQISNAISGEIMVIFAGLIMIVGSLAMMFTTNLELTLIYLIIAPIMAIATNKRSKFTKKLFRTSKAKLAKMTSNVEEMFSAEKTVKMFSLEDKNYVEFEKISDEYNESAFKSEYSAGLMMPTTNIISNIGFFLIAIFGSFFVIGGRISVGAVSAFVVYSKQFMGPIVETANVYNTIQSAISSSERILYILNEETEPELLTENVDLKGNIKFENVSFSYVEGKKVLKNINFEVKAGEKVGILGHTGCGKTTLISLLMRFYDVSEGRILVDGKDIKEYNLDNLRTNFGLVLQENFLFDMDILQNVSYGLKEFDEEKTKASIKEVMMDKYIENLEDGYKTLLSYENTAISEGQIQLLVIARAMLTNPNVYIFDEATSNVDLITEKNIKNVSAKIMENKTAFIIAHRLSTISSCDKLIVMDGGEIVEMGSPKELLEKKGRYYSYVNT